MTKSPFSLVPCPNTCMDEGQNVRWVMRRDLEQICASTETMSVNFAEKGTYLSIKVHGNICMPCPNAECSENVDRLHIREHVNDRCSHTEVKCKYANVGCEVKMKRSLIKEHEQNDAHHLHKAMDAVISMQKAIMILKERTDTLSTEDYVTFKNTRVTEGVIKLSCRHHSIPVQMATSWAWRFILTDMPMLWDRMCQHMYIHILRGQYNQWLEWQLVGSISIELLNQLADKSPYKKMLKLRKQDNARAADDEGGATRTIFLCPDCCLIKSVLSSS